MSNRFENVREILQVLDNQNTEPLSSIIPVDSAFRLRVMQGVQRGTIYLLTPEKSLYGLGRGMTNDIQLEDFSTTYMSRYHATIECAPSLRGWFLLDGQWSDEDRAWVLSTNGTWLNSSLVDGRRGKRLSEGDLIIMGDTTLRVEAMTQNA
jgi:pSer/pThr/pTyr-binding forkhead associated (FHA) protein